MFRLKLTPDSSVFAEDVTFESTRGPLAFDPGITYTGILEGKQASNRSVMYERHLFVDTAHLVCFTGSGLGK